MAQADYDLYCLVRKTSNVQLHKELGVNLVYGDVTDRQSILDGMKGCEWVIDLANIYEFWHPDKSLFEKVNIDGTRNVMECALEIGAAKVMHVSTALTYGKPTNVPFTEASQPGPEQFSEYARTKRLGDLVAWKLFEEKGLPLVGVYPVGVMGPGDTKATFQVTSNLVKRRMPATVFDSTMLSFVYVKDVAEIIVRAMEKEGNIGEKYLASSEQITLGDAYRTICEFAGVKMPFIRLPDWLIMLNAILLTSISDIFKVPPWLGMSVDQMRTMKEGWVCDGDKAVRELGITYVTVREMIRQEVAGAQRNPTL
ncbi:MAG: NAD-dependent epimerase/dehydratase family protein [Anaerolineaceae bacterium]|nr:NAD-dependent epimerase/dehydratase family protein [Anaerolineaceae bacterium]